LNEDWDPRGYKERGERYLWGEEGHNISNWNGEKGVSE